MKQHPQLFLKNVKHLQLASEKHPPQLLQVNMEYHPQFFQESMEYHAQFFKGNTKYFPLVYQIQMSILIQTI